MSSNTLIDQRLLDLETKISFQELTIEELNQSLIEQQFCIEKLQLQVHHLAKKLIDIQPSNIASQAEETPPPHY